jgi:hypothetical protein
MRFCGRSARTFPGSSAPLSFGTLRRVLPASLDSGPMPGTNSLDRHGPRSFTRFERFGQAAATLSPPPATSCSTFELSRSADWPGHLRSIAIERVGGRSTTIVGAPLSRGHLWAVNLAGGRTHERDSLAALAPDRDERLTLQARRGNEVRDILQWPQGLVLRNRRKSWLPA